MHPYFKISAFFDWNRIYSRIENWNWEKLHLAWAFTFYMMSPINISNVMKLLKRIHDIDIYCSSHCVNLYISLWWVAQFNRYVTDCRWLIMETGDGDTLDQVMVIQHRLSSVKILQIITTFNISHSLVQTNILNEWYHWSSFRDICNKPLPTYELDSI